MSKKGRDSDEDEIKHIMITKKKSREWVLAKNPRLVSENPQKKDLRLDGMAIRKPEMY